MQASGAGGVAILSRASALTNAPFAWFSKPLDEGLLPRTVLKRHIAVSAMLRRLWPFSLFMSSEDRATNKGGDE